MYDLCIYMHTQTHTHTHTHISATTATITNFFYNHAPMENGVAGGKHRFCPKCVLQAAGDQRALMEKIPQYCMLAGEEHVATLSLS